MSKSLFKNTQAGFGLVELMVSIGILMIVMSIVLVNHSRSNSAVLLRSQAYEIALDTREVQLAAVSALGDTSSFRNILGIHFATANSGYYYRFKDGSPYNYFFSSGEEMLRENLDKRFEISAIRTVNGATETAVSALSVVFERPNFDARFYTAAGTLFLGNAVEIDVRVRGASDVRTVEITRVGQISVQ